MQIKLQHSRAATDNLMKLIQQDNTDIVFIREPNLYQNKIAGIISSHRKYISLDDKFRAGIININNKIDAVLIKQLSSPDSVLLELITLDF